MKQLLFACLLLCPVIACAQPTTTTIQGQPNQRIQYKGYVGADKGLVIPPAADLGTGTFPGQIRVKPDGSIWVWTGSAWVPSGTGGGSAPVLARTEFEIVAGANSVTLTNSALANMTISRISYAGRTYNTAFFTKIYGSSSLSLSTAGAMFYNGQVITITPDSLTAAGPSGLSGGGGSTPIPLSYSNDCNYVIAINGADTIRLISARAWEAWSDSTRSFWLQQLAQNEIAIQQTADAQRALNDVNLRPYATRHSVDWKLSTFFARSDANYYRVEIWLNAAFMTEALAAATWYTQITDRRLVRFYRLKAGGTTEETYTGTSLPTAERNTIRIIPESAVPTTY